MNDWLLMLWRPAIEILFLWVLIYSFLVFLKDTRGVQVLTGLLVIVVLFVVTQRMGLETIEWLMTKLFAISLIGLLVIFQPELRRLLARLGQHRWLQGWGWTQADQAVEEICEALAALSKERHGALIALERNTALKSYAESGVVVDGRVTRELLCTIFMPNAPLHDGGVVIIGDRVVAAGCLFPLSQSPRLSKTTGTRHRAAVGLSEEADAVVLVVSEETGAISLSAAGRLSRDLGAEQLGQTLRALYRPSRGRWVAAVASSA